MELRNKTVLVTGGGSGLGKAYASALHGSANTVIICGRRRDPLDEVAAAHEGLVAIQCDIGDDAAVEAMLAQITDQHGGIDVLINNAGLYQEYDFPTAEDTPERVDLEVNVNLIAPLKLTYRALPQIRERRGAVINITSGLAFVPFAPAPVHSATKAAMHFFTHNLRRQLADSGVAVFEVMPPPLDTAINDGVTGLTLMDPAEAVRRSLMAIGKGQTEIVIGQAKGLRFMSRVAPGFIEGQISKGDPRDGAKGG